MGWVRKVVLYGLLLVLFSLGFVFFSATQGREPPADLAGYRQIVIDAPHRGRDLDVFVWYPTDADGPPGLVNQNALFYGFHAQVDAPGTGRAAPVVVLSHGSGGNAPGLGWIASQLAARGMIVLAPNHPGTTSRDSLPSETVKIWERPDDLSVILDAAADSLPLGIEADLDRVGAMGFSLGGFSALALAGVEVSKDRFIAYCAANPDVADCGWMNRAGLDFQSIDAAQYDASHKDPRVLAVVTVDPALPQAVREDGFESFGATSLILQLGEDVPVALQWSEVAARAPSITHRVIPGASHFHFLPECSFLGKVAIGLGGDDNICSDRWLRPRAEVQKEIAPMIVNFFAEALQP